LSMNTFVRSELDSLQHTKVIDLEECREIQ
jgi:hypothetical protein